MKRKVLRAKVHDIQVVIQGIGSLERDLPPINKSIPVEMHLDTDHPGMLFVTVKGIETFIPLANVQIGFLAPEEKVAPTSPSSIATAPVIRR